jgi:hypothetical protein
MPSHHEGLQGFSERLAHLIQQEGGRAKKQASDFSVVLFRPNFMLVSDGHPMKVHKNQWLSTLLSLLTSLVEPRTRAHTRVSGGQMPSQ